MRHTVSGLAIAALVFIATRSPVDALNVADTVVPESAESKVDFTAFSKLAPTSFLQAVIKSGGTKADCRTFATTTISTIKTDVQSAQATLEAVDTGSGCAQEGQTIVTQDLSALSTAQGDLVIKQGEAATALSAKNTACSADVNFAVPLDHLKVNSACYDYTNEASFAAAEASCVSATTASTKDGQAVVIAQAAVDILQQEYDKSVADAADLKNACQCRVQAEQTAAWKAASAAAHAADWKQAHEVICTLDQPSKCVVPICPTVTQPTVAEGVNGAACTSTTSAGSVTLAPTDAPTTAAPTDTPTTLAPTDAPTDAPTTLAPTYAPTDAPTTLAPTYTPTTLAPTYAPTDAPTIPRCTYRCTCVGQVKIFQNGGYSGWEMPFSKGDYGESKRLITADGHNANNGASSLKVPTCCKVVLWQKDWYSGWWETFTAGDHPTISHNKKNALHNDEMSSLKVMDDPGCCLGCVGQVEIFGWPSYGGWMAPFSKGDYGNSKKLHFKKDGGWTHPNNDASSLKVPQCCKVVLYQNDWYGGWSETFTAGDHPTISHNDEMSSLKVMDDPACTC